MNLPPNIRETAAGITTGTAGVTFPWWGDVISVMTGVNQLLVSLLGLIVLILSVKKLLAENRRTALEIAALEKKRGGG